jgi:membrane-bound lytic murein transglycosylase MltF
VIGEYDELIKQSVIKHMPAYDWRLLKALLWEESKMNPFAVSHVGAKGIAQFMPETWKEWRTKAGYSRHDETHPEASIFTAACYMEWLLGQWRSPRPPIDRFCLAAASYNSGLGDILKAQKAAGMVNGYREIIAKLPEIEPQHCAETIRYVKRILGYFAQEITG